MKRLLGVVVFILILAAILFTSAGRLDWPMAWVYCATVTVSSVVTSLHMDSELLEEHCGIQGGTKDSYIVLGILMSLATFIAAGLDVRFESAPRIPPTLQMAAWGIVALGLLLADWAIVVNRFFSAVVRIQKDRGHTVVTSGPYSFVRHPGYAGSILHDIAIPLMLGSLWALVPAAIKVLLTLIRTAREDKLLQNELDGYREYVRRVGFRLMPMVW